MISGPWGALKARLNAPVDASGLAAFRVAIGLLVAFSAARFFLYGWVEEFFLKPTFFFKYWGFSWVPHPGDPGIYWLFGALIALGVLVALGVLHRLASAILCILFVWVQLLDQVNYLNHYYLVSLLLGLLALIPLGNIWSIAPWLRPARRLVQVPAWMVYLLRFQVACVYFYAGKAKLSEDWLLSAQPLNIWLSARTDFPLLGQLFIEPSVAYLFAWAGFLFDTTIWLWLLWGRTRLFAYAVVLGFHLLTGLLFPIGLFPLIMVLAALVFFPPNWPKRVVTWMRLGRGGRLFTHRSGGNKHSLEVGSAIQPERPELLPQLETAVSRGGAANARAARYQLKSVGIILLSGYCGLQLLLPLRMHFYPGNVLWHEQGMRFAWKVMVRKKNASVTYHLEDKNTGRRWYSRPHEFLDARQEREFGTQPDMVLQLAHHIADLERRRGREVRVRAEVWVSLNGRSPLLLIDPAIDLAELSDGIKYAEWILPEPTEQPPLLRPTR